MSDPVHFAKQGTDPKLISAGNECVWWHEDSWGASLIAFITVLSGSYDIDGLDVVIISNWIIALWAFWGQASGNHVINLCRGKAKFLHCLLGHWKNYKQPGR